MCEHASPFFSPGVRPPLSESVSPSPASVVPPPLSVETLPPLSNTQTQFPIVRTTDFSDASASSLVHSLWPVSVVSLPPLSLSEVSLPHPSSPPPPSLSSPLPGAEPPPLSLLAPRPCGEPSPPWLTCTVKDSDIIHLLALSQITFIFTAAQSTYLACSSCCLRSSSSFSLCSRASRRFSARIRLASSGSVVPAEGLYAGGLLIFSKKH